MLATGLGGPYEYSIHSYEVEKYSIPGSECTDLKLINSSVVRFLGNSDIVPNGYSL